MERSVELLVAGGLVLLAGLWAVHLGVRWSAVWSLGVVASLAGLVALGLGIARELTTWPFEAVGPR